MRRVLLAAGLPAISLVSASQATAATSVPVSMTLAEPLKTGAQGNAVCPDIGIAVNCGSGELLPFGHATEEVNIGVCGETCNVGQIDLAEGSITLQEASPTSSSAGRGSSQAQPGP